MNLSRISFRGNFLLLSRVLQLSSSRTVQLKYSRCQLRGFQTTAKMPVDKTLFGVETDVVNLVKGAPGIRHLRLATDIIQKATQHLFSLDSVKDDSYVLQYGPRLGSTHARDSIAKFLSEGYGDEVKGDNIVITSGATNGLAMACTHFFKSGDVVFVEDPSYFIAINMLKQDMGMKVIPVPTTEEGIDIDTYEKLLEQHCPSGKVTDTRPFRAMLYMIPTYHNPRGYILPPESCKRLVALARKYDVLNFSEDVYNFLHFDVDTRAPPRFLTYDKPSDPDYKGHTISNCTISKILSPGLRLGWWETSPRIVNLIFKSNILWGAGCSNHYASEIVASAIDLGLQQSHIKTMNREYQQKIANVYALMKEQFPEGVKFKHLQGGYFFWIEMPENWNGTEVAKLALDKYKVQVLPGISCSAAGNYSNCLRMSIAYQDEDVLKEGAHRLAEALKHYKSKQ
ncbi:hypothetical protein LSH36_658g00021 [Paralvinella palmiformis]|uniref:Aminotransferase class I/classII large domain-containing protein n=1 Tax=Paralvinella palmiformis TaxID=53620 RepID=A0AAD9J3P0_9ANNE|nr:hypothetical protein LSH36_658g00021 [Paralvinella palmiformis]